MYEGVSLVCTEATWSRLHYKEIFLVCRLIEVSSNTISPTKTQEHIIYPPYFAPNPEKNTSGTIPFRLLTHRMTNEKGGCIDIWMLCGQTPPLMQLTQVIIPAILYPSLTPPLSLAPLLDVNLNEIFPKGTATLFVLHFFLFLFYLLIEEKCETVFIFIFPFINRLFIYFYFDRIFTSTVISVHE